MDNITHSLVGALIGDAASRHVREDPAGLPAHTRRGLGIALMVVGNNLPDTDFLYSTITGSKLDYLLQHRGHTHTIIGALLISGLMLLVARAWLRHRNLRVSPADWKFLLGLALVAPLLHLCLDATNSYGIHPFWPFDSRWFYGDAVFIVEPLLWAVATPLLFTVRTWVARLVIGLILLTGIALSFGTGLVPLPMAIALVALIGLLAGIARYAAPRLALATGISAWLLVTCAFLFTGQTAQARVEALLAREYPAAITLDIVLTPMPVNPLCREVFAVQTEAGRYVVRKAMHSLVPGWFAVERCPHRTSNQEATVPLAPASAADTPEIVWLGEIGMPRSLMDDLTRDYCSVRALLHFARVPWSIADGEGWIVGDARYDREPELGMAEIAAGPAEDECPAFIPAWTPPRADLLGKQGED